MKSISNSRELSTLLARNKVMMLKFSATWCGPCKAVAPVVEKLAQQYPQVPIYDVDIDANSDIAGQYNITGVPAFIFFRKGTEIDRVTGADVNKVTALVRQLAAEAAPSLKDYSQGYTLGGPAAAKEKARPSHANAPQLPNVVEWLKLYVYTFFSFDAKKTADSLRAH